MLFLFLFFFVLIVVFCFCFFSSVLRQSSMQPKKKIKIMWKSFGGVLRYYRDGNKQIYLLYNQCCPTFQETIDYLTMFFFIQEFLELWPDLDVIVDNGTIGNSQESRLGSTVVDLTQPDEFAIVRAGCAYDYVVYVLKEKYGFKQRQTD